MPTYDYECQACGHHFELFQSMTAAVKRKCPKCTAPALKRLIGPGAGFLFKGDGFYSTDYRSEWYKSGQKAAKSDAAETPPPSSGKDGSDKGTGDTAKDQPSPAATPKPRKKASTPKASTPKRPR